MTPNDRKIEIMNRTYASVVQNLTNKIIELKMDQQIDLDNITIPTDFQLQIRADVAIFETRKLEAKVSFYRAICIVQVLVVTGVAIMWSQGVI